ncbi:AAA family ATPase [Streptomyces sp. NPDC057694]|uniref:AAA family ATPase n=1 Tax=Streptomyces sp. NPDC057694 TaxID=3346216 RepID=UPI00369B84C6
MTGTGRTITVHKELAGAYATTAPAVAGVRIPRQRSVRDLRGRGGRTPHRIGFAAGDLVVLSGLPGSGKSTLMRRVVTVVRIDSQDTRERWAARMPRRLPYALYRPLVRLAHYAGLRRAIRSGASVVVHDCGTQAWVRHWVTRMAGRRGAAVHLILLDVPADLALEGMRDRGRGVSRYAFARHRRAVTALVTSTEAGDLPAGIESAVLLDRAASDALGGITFLES